MQTQTTPQQQTPAPVGAQPQSEPKVSSIIGSAARSVWEVVTMIPHPTNEKAKTRCSMLVAAEHIDQVWEYIAGDRMDAATEVEVIAKVGPLVAILPPTTN